jgi:hypothetical protein
VVDDAGIRLEAACSGSSVSRCEKGDLAVLLDPPEDRRRAAPTDLRSRAGARESVRSPPGSHSFLGTPAVKEPVTFSLMARDHTGTSAIRIWPTNFVEPAHAKVLTTAGWN